MRRESSEVDETAENEEIDRQVYDGFADDDDDDDDEDTAAPTNTM